MFSDKVDEEWEAYGKDDPYFGVHSVPRYRKANLSPEMKEAFFAEGETHIERALAFADRHCGPLTYGTALDYGCGVGRLVLPLTQRFTHVIGVDVSPSMLAEAEKNAMDRETKNASFALVKDNNMPVPDASVDFIHSFIVFQHIPVRRGMRMLSKLIDCLAPGGVAAIHLTFHREAPKYVKMVHSIRKRFSPAHYAVNILDDRRWNEPLMRMHLYDLNAVQRLLHYHGIKDSHVQLEEDGTYLGVFLFFRKP